MQLFRAEELQAGCATTNKDVKQKLGVTHLKHKGILVGSACVQQLVQGLAPAQPAPPRSLHMHTQASLVLTSMRRHQRATPANREYEKPLVCPYVCVENSPVLLTFELLHSNHFCCYSRLTTGS